MQDVHFNSVEELLDYLPRDERNMVEVLRHLVFDSVPRCREKLAYQVPFYSGFRRICFIRPGSVPWGKVRQQGVQLGFCYGFMMEDETGFLEKGNRKQVYIKTFMKPSDINADLVKAYLFEAVRVDEAMRKIRRG